MGAASTVSGSARGAGVNGGADDLDAGAAQAVSTRKHNISNEGVRNAAYMHQVYPMHGLLSRLGPQQMASEQSDRHQQRDRQIPQRNHLVAKQEGEIAEERHRAD